MCGACGSSRKVSDATAFVNEQGLKYQLLGQLRSALPAGQSLVALQDRWALKGRNGTHLIFDDVEELLAHVHESFSIDISGWRQGSIRRG